MKAQVILIMGSASDMAHAEKIESALSEFGIPCQKRIASAHKTAEHLIAMLKKYESDGTQKVYITAAGRSNALSGFVDGFVRGPTIACPPASDTFGGADIFSSLRMPSGISPALVLEPRNAALLAAKIFSLFDAETARRVAEHAEANAHAIIEEDAKLV